MKTTLTSPVSPVWPSFGWLLLALALLLIGCGGGQSAPQAPADPSGLTPAQLENGIGPVSDLQLGPIDQALVARGTESFKIKCSACHKLDQRYVGPALNNILAERSPAYIMNMMLNPDEMVKIHPEAKKKLAEFMTVMPNQNLQQDEARAILEYLRTVQTEQ